MTFRPALPCAAIACASVLVLCKPARAQQPEIEPPAQRRSGFVFGLAGGLSLGQAAGNPTAQAERYDPAHRASTGFALGYRATPYIGGALTDWFTFGLGGSYGQMASGSEKSSVGLFLFRIETFPLFYRGGVYRDLGVSVEFGAGATSIKRKSDGSELANSGVASTIGVGAFWETWRVGHFSLGPCLAWQHNWSDWYARNDVTLGLKGNFYGGP